MNRVELGLKVAGLVISTSVSVATLIVEKRKKTEISDQDKYEIADMTSDRVIEKLSLISTNEEN